MRQNTSRSLSTETLFAQLAKIPRKKDSDNPRNPSQTAPPTVLPAQLPLWPCNVRAMPNEICRSAIFTVRNSHAPRVTIQNKPIFVVGNGKITYTGIELRAEDDELV